MAVAAPSSPRRSPLAAWPPRAQWPLLVVLSALFAFGLIALRLPAALLLGPMLAAIAVAANGGTIRLPFAAFYAAQALIGCMIADRLPLTLFGEIGRDWPIFLGGVVSVIAAASLLGWLLARWRVLPGSTAIWGSAPGAATVMTVMSEDYGADMRLVALMQYLRVVCCAIVASLVGRIWATGGGTPAPATVAWFAPTPLAPLATTLALAAIGVLAGFSRRIPAGAMLTPFVLGLLFKGAFGVPIALPPWLLAASYGGLGWAIGARFTPEIVGHAARALPRIFASILALIAICAGFGAILHAVAGVDPLTAFLATSPGGADSVAIIAASSKVDLPFVMAMQVTRFVLVILVGPLIARFVAERSRRD